MKLLRWALASASVYVFYRYSIGRKAAGEDIFVTPESALPAPVENGGEEQPTGNDPRRTRRQASRQAR